MRELQMEWEPVIGLEIHVQLATRSKIFSGASTAYGAAPNTQACKVTLGLPGVLPVLNKQAVLYAVKFGLAIGAHINTRSIFARKNYFYPDLPKGYQISQYELPIVAQGCLEIELEDGETKTIGITRAHLEEDAGKSLHEDYAGMTGIDLNRAGTPLIEIVSEPDMRSAREAVAYMRKIHSLVRYLNISDGNMQEGSFRCDANVSVRPRGQTEFGTRAEIKNLNSFRFVERAINHEIERQIDLLTDGGTVVQETRLYDADKDCTRAMRSKEEANDYRYFPDPDLLPVLVSEEMLQQVREQLPELPDEKKKRFCSQYSLKEIDAIQLTSSRELADYFETVVEHAQGEAKLASNWVLVELLGALNAANQDISESPLDAVRLGKLIARISDNTISGKIAKDLFKLLWESDKDVDVLISEQGLQQITDTGELEKLVDEVVSNNPEQVEQYKSGKDKVFGFFVGQVMKATAGKANPQQVNELLKKRLSQ
ncbi:MAG: Asp-tRNA(Asn)/Glu-tRNA(Gln) amidotransferase subunit GatB [Planctomycetaceae bacterium]|nr:Asp-tRNA(Asn)/Glu-tRNA(Gln) amidotransferase subunit GatB [Planctomycetaceae bacterium]